MALLLKADARGATDDNAETYQAFVKSRAIPPSDVAKLTGVTQQQQPILLARSGSGVSLSLTIDKNFGLEVPAPTTILLTPGGSEVGVIKKFEGAAQDDVFVVQLQLGDAAAVANTWSLDALHVKVTEDGDK